LPGLSRCLVYGELWRRAGRKRQAYRERGAGAEAGAAGFERAAVHLDEVPGEREADAEAAVGTGPGGIGLHEKLEDERQHLGCDAHALVVDLDDCFVPLAAPRKIDLSSSV
jgi:hypothetical protein